MIVVKDYATQQESAAVAGILLHLRKQEERQQRLQWMGFFAIIGVFVIVMLLLAVKLR